VLAAANQFLLPNCVACNELIFAAKLCGLQRINFAAEFYGACSKSVFAVEFYVANDSIFTVEI
jgi:hypothetical protein